jgi:hypothetical protein
MKKEIAVSKEGMTLARSKFEPMEKENTNLRVEIKHLQHSNSISWKVSWASCTDEHFENNIQYNKSG